MNHNHKSTLRCFRKVTPPVPE